MENSSSNIISIAKSVSIILELYLLVAHHAHSCAWWISRISATVGG